MEDEISSDEGKDEIIYDMCGYLLKIRDSVWIDCVINAKKV
jgi:regulation of enolase protein 1 (concanavalin A-like superfamily)